MLRKLNRLRIVHVVRKIERVVVDNAGIIENLHGDHARLFPAIRVGSEIRKEFPTRLWRIELPVLLGNIHIVGGVYLAIPGKIIYPKDIIFELARKLQFAEARRYFQCQTALQLERGRRLDIGARLAAAPFHQRIEHLPGCIQKVFCSS